MCLGVPLTFLLPSQPFLCDILGSDVARDPNSGPPFGLVRDPFERVRKGFERLREALEGFGRPQKGSVQFNSLSLAQVGPFLPFRRYFWTHLSQYMRQTPDSHLTRLVRLIPFRWVQRVAR